MTKSYPVVYGYVRVSDRQEGAAQELRDELATWCAREGWHLGAVFTDVSAGIDVDDRIGFLGLLDALALPQARGAVVLDPAQLSPRPELITRMMRKMRATGSAVVCRSGELPPMALKHCQGQPELTS
ncbi:recombinase family protein [Actinokineospora sp.]|uniref:recombinase family protein n=1 Tax=Actinokineospora sp. TaxID=1872133 RepID=UPI003D6C3DE7